MNKLNRLNSRFFFSFFLCVSVLVLIGGCKKKDRLSSSTFNFVVSPPAATVLKTATLTLSASGSSSGGSVSVSPTWQVIPSTIGTLSSSIGTSVVFTPTALGTVVVTATYDGLMATSQIDIVTYIPGDSIFSVYNDDGLPTTSGASVSDIFVSGGMTLTELSSGYTPEGIAYQQSSDVDTNDFWGVTLDDNSVNASRDLSTFNSGNLEFSLRLSNRTMANGEVLRIQLEDLGSTVGVDLVSGSFGFNRLSTNWQEISIPISSFVGLNTTQVKVPFAIVATNLSSTLIFDVDAIRWEP